MGGLKGTGGGRPGEERCRRFVVGLGAWPSLGFWSIKDTVLGNVFVWIYERFGKQGNSNLYDLALLKNER